MPRNIESFSEKLQETAELPEVLNILREKFSEMDGVEIIGKNANQGVALEYEGGIVYMRYDEGKDAFNVFGADEMPGENWMTADELVELDSLDSISNR